MPSFGKRYDARVKKEAIGMLENLLKKIKKDEFKVNSHGMWGGGTQGSWVFRFDIKEVNDSEVSK